MQIIKKVIKMLKQIWRLAYPYWSSPEDRFAKIGLLATAVVMTLLVTAAAVRMNRWFGDWFTAYTEVDYAAWIQQLIIFFMIGIIMVLMGIFRPYVNGWITVKWREWMTSKYLQNWMKDNSHYRMQFAGNLVDNPDQRISEDIRAFIGSTWMYTFILFSNLLMLIAFFAVLWNLSAEIPLLLGGRDWSFPGYFIVIAFVWAMLGTFVVHVIGKFLIRINFNQMRYEADFRFSLVRVRENSEQIALLKGTNVEHTRSMGVFNNIIGNTYRLLARTMKVEAVQGSFNQIDGVLISLLLGPVFFAGLLPGGFGAIMQVSQAFATVLGLFKFFQNAYEGLTGWKAVINRLTGFLDGAEIADRILQQSRIGVLQGAPDEISVPDLDVNLPDGKKLITAKGIKIRHGDKVLIKGKTGAGKTTFFRVISGIWPFGKGDFTIPKDKKVMLLPQKPYFPIGTLADSISYPEPASVYKRDDIKQALRDVGLELFTGRLDEFAHWNQILSGGEQQRVAIARALLYKPDYLFFDEATSSIDEPSEEALYEMLMQKMQNTTIVSIGHRSSLEKYHKRMLVAEAQPAGDYALEEKKIG